MVRLTVATLASMILACTVAVADNTITPADHFRIENPAKLTDVEAENIYTDIALRMQDGYAQSRDQAAMEYQTWQRFNSAPYLSAGHGNRFLNNYGNDAATGYLKLKNGETIQMGAILAKDSFTVTGDKRVHPGALFLMEKLTANKSPTTADWRYVMLLPDGSVLGDTLGANPNSMSFCHSCHQSASGTDYLFQLPADALR